MALVTTCHRVQAVNYPLLDLLSLQGRLHYLDFFDRMLTPDGTSLDPSLQFDGTHLSPAYIPLLAESMGRLE